ncbi:D-Ala-D-Ala carboxypeptidase family metallohydrolase [Litorimonas haliclonae]|uniref:D-Ala-D-Ala carboxypeptidase family metallohydrolase n=1 Tax=Litorimonas haliclonae TaxID=2081977 RepID=UPI0039EEFBBA
MSLKNLLCAAPIFGALFFTPFAQAPFAKAQAEMSAISVPTLDKEAIPYAVWHTTRLPGEKLNLELPTGFTAELDGAPVTPDTRVLNKAGSQMLTVKKPDGSRLSRVSVFTLEPLSEVDEKGWLNGYRIGEYPKNPPRGFIRLDSEADKDINVAPHFKLGQFLCKQQPDAWPKYVLVTQSNLKRLETLRESLVKDDITDAQTFFVMSGFRTPFYNSAIGSAKLSRHMYGDAADIYIDVKPRDGNMDDINQDGAINKTDANYLYDYAAKLFAKSDKVQPGGIGSYKANAVHGPFVHVDGRGHVARWGR